MQMATRKRGETVAIGEGPGTVLVTVFLIGKDSVRLTIDAPDGVKVECVPGLAPGLDEAAEEYAK